MSPTDQGPAGRRPRTALATPSGAVAELPMWMEDPCAALPPTDGVMLAAVEACHAVPDHCDPWQVSATAPPLSDDTWRTIVLCKALVAICRGRPGYPEPIRRLWALQARPGQRTHLLLPGQLSHPGGWWADAGFAAEAVVALRVAEAEAARFLRDDHEMLRSVLDHPASTAWPAGTWLALWLIADWRSADHDLVAQLLPNGEAGQRLRRAAMQRLITRTTRAPWHLTADDLLPLLEDPIAEIRLWAQLQFGALSTKERAQHAPTAREAGGPSETERPKEELAPAAQTPGPCLPRAIVASSS